MSNTETPQDVWEVLNVVCTLPQIHRLLRDKADLYKRGEIRIGSGKEEMISNLRTAVSSRKIEISDVHSLIRDAEENGNQHIFFYRPKSGKLAKKYSDPDAMATTLFGTKWQSRFPAFQLKKDSFIWADFRPNGTGSKGWTGKLYG